MAWPIFLRCQSCNRIVSARSRQCPRCKRWTGAGHGDPSLDRGLEAIRSFGVMTGLWSAAGAVSYFFAGAPIPAGVMAALSAILVGGVSLDDQEVNAIHAEEAGRGTAGALGPAAFLAGLLLVPAAMGLAILPHLDALLPR